MLNVRNITNVTDLKPKSMEDVTPTDICNENENHFETSSILSSEIIDSLLQTQDAQENSSPIPPGDSPLFLPKLEDNSSLFQYSNSSILNKSPEEIFVDTSPSNEPQASPIDTSFCEGISDLPTNIQQSILSNINFSELTFWLSEDKLVPNNENS